MAHSAGCSALTRAVVARNRVKSRQYFPIPPVKPGSSGTRDPRSLTARDWSLALRVSNFSCTQNQGEKKAGDLFGASGALDLHFPEIGCIAQLDVTRRCAMAVQLPAVVVPANTLDILTRFPFVFPAETFCSFVPGRSLPVGSRFAVISILLPCAGASQAR